MSSKGNPNCKPSEFMRNPRQIGRTPSRRPSSPPASATGEQACRRRCVTEPSAESEAVSLRFPSRCRPEPAGTGQTLGLPGTVPWSQGSKLGLREGQVRAGAPGVQSGSGRSPGPSGKRSPGLALTPHPGRILGAPRARLSVFGGPWRRDVSAGRQVRFQDGVEVEAFNKAPGSMTQDEKAMKAPSWPPAPTSCWQVTVCVERPPRAPAMPVPP